MSQRKKLFLNESGRRLYLKYKWDYLTLTYLRSLMGDLIIFLNFLFKIKENSKLLKNNKIKFSFPYAE